MHNRESRQQNRPTIPIDYMLLVLSGIFLLVGFVAFAILPQTVNVTAYKVPVLSFLVALVLTAIGNIVVGFIQRGVSKEAARALTKPLDDLHQSVEKLHQIQIFFDAGLVGIFPNRSSAMQRFRSEIEREDRTIDFVGTSLLGTLDPAQENEEKMALHRLLLQKRQNGVRIRALLMHPAYGEFRERVENRERAAVARDIQGTLRYLLPIESRKTVDSDTDSPQKATERLLEKEDVRLYPGVITALAIFTGRAMLVNLSTLHGPVYDNFSLIVEDTPDPNSIFKRFKANHFQEPWGSEKTVRLDLRDSSVLTQLLDLNFAAEDNRFKEGNWPATIPQRVASGGPLTQGTVQAKPN